MPIFNGKHISNEDLAYFAGILDGEGSVYISHPIRGNRKDIKMPIYHTVFSVTNTEMELLQWIHKRFEGTIRSIKTDKNTTAIRRPIWRWYCYGKGIQEICELLLPYIVIKKRQLEIMRDIRKTYFRRSVKGKIGVQPVPQDVIDFRHKCYKELKLLHTRPNLRHANLISLRHSPDDPTKS